MLVKLSRIGRTGTIFATGCFAFALIGFGQDTGSTQNSQPSTQQQKSKSKEKKSKNKKSTRTDRTGDHPMDEKPPIRQPGRMDTPTMPQRTPGQQPAPGTADPTSPTTVPK